MGVLDILGSVSRDKSLAATADGGASSTAAAATDAGSAPLEGASVDALAGSFLHVLRMEKRRADRTNAPLSLVLMRADQAGSQAAAPALALQTLATVLLGLKRETDRLASFGRDGLAVLLPDTPAVGRDEFIARASERLKQADASLVLSTSSSTYPDLGFEHIEQGLGLASEDAVIFDDTTLAPGADYVLKRPLDIVGATLALVLLAPVMVGVALAVAWSSPGPVIFRQQRLGRGGAPFEFLKFRSMTLQADDSLHRRFVADLIRPGHAAGSPGPDGPRPEPTAAVYKIRADPRVTPVGRFLRRTSLDELPQLFNVLRGDMSLVGPRPPIAYEARNYRAWHLRRLLRARPGITGLWQVNGRSRVPFDEMVRMDLRYIEQCSLALDLRLLLKTVAVVLRGDGAR